MVPGCLPLGSKAPYVELEIVLLILPFIEKSYIRRVLLCCDSLLQQLSIASAEVTCFRQQK